MAHEDMKPFCIKIGPEKMNDPSAMASFQEAMDEVFVATRNYEQELAKELNISIACAVDVTYLRGRSRWTQELENELIELHKAGTPPNIYDFGNGRQQTSI